MTHKSEVWPRTACRVLVLHTIRELHVPGVISFDIRRDLVVQPVAHFLTKRPSRTHGPRALTVAVSSAGTFPDAISAMGSSIMSGFALANDFPPLVSAFHAPPRGTLLYTRATLPEASCLVVRIASGEILEMTKCIALLLCAVNEDRPLLRDARNSSVSRTATKPSHLDKCPDKLRRIWQVLHRNGQAVQASGMYS